VNWHLFVDADDTLWENNVFFERAFDSFAEYLAHPAMTVAEVRAALDEIEHVNNRLYGYGSVNFARNLKACFERLGGRALTRRDYSFINDLQSGLFDHPMELMPDVEETLAYLNGRHHLTLCTKGQPEEQRKKLERSGLSGFFHGVEVVKEKDADLYRKLGAGKEVVWMIGNSPKSDINPSLEAGLRAVYIPHVHTWHLEHQEMPERHERLLVLERFGELRGYF